MHSSITRAESAVFWSPMTYVISRTSIWPKTLIVHRDGCPWMRSNRPRFAVDEVEARQIVRDWCMASGLHGAVDCCRCWPDWR